MHTMRRHRYTILTVVLTVLVVWYLATAKQSTRNSPFYKKTAAAIERRRTEGPQAPGPAHRPFLKGGSIRPSDEDQRPIDTTPLDSNEDDLLQQIDTQMGKQDDLVAEVERLDRGLEDADAHSKFGKTPEDIELERQIIKARKREQQKLKDEIRDKLKRKERERQAFLSTKVVNQNWVGAFEKERKPAKAVGNADEMEVAPDSDPFRDKAPREDEAERAPDSDPFRDQKSDEPYEAAVPVSQVGLDGAEERKSEQQQEKLAKEQEYLEPIRPTAGKQHSTEDDSWRPQAKAQKLEEHGSSNGKPSRKADTPDTRQLSRLSESDADSAEVKRRIANGRDAGGANKRDAARGDAEQGALNRHKILQDGVGHGGQGGKEAPTKTATKDAILQDTQPAESTSTGPSFHKTPAELELSHLLALSPIVIFSKTHCPFSKKAKRILTQAFHIMPTPYVVELDTHEHGKELQKLLKQQTGRGTVPNIIIEGQSLGGGDDVQGLYESGELRDVLKEVGGRRVLRVEENEIAARDI